MEQVDTESNREQTDTDKSTPQMSLASLHSKGTVLIKHACVCQLQLYLIIFCRNVDIIVHVGFCKNTSHFTSHFSCLTS